MSTVAVYNGFGKYETSPKGEKGISLSHGGVPFWFPFEQVTYLPDYTFREVDHAASTADNEAESVLTYKTFRVSGQRLAEEMLDTQVPVRNREKGIITIAQERRKLMESRIQVLAGHSEDGQPLYVEVQEIKPAIDEIESALRMAQSFKEQTVQEYLQSKRERMAGGHGQTFAKGLTKVFMEELGIKDIDDISRQIGGNADLNALIAALRGNMPLPVFVPTVKSERRLEDLV